MSALQNTLKPKEMIFDSPPSMQLISVDSIQGAMETVKTVPQIQGLNELLAKLPVGGQDKKLISSGLEHIAALRASGTGLALS